MTVLASGTYTYDYNVSVNEAGSLELTDNGTVIAGTNFGRQTGTTQIIGHGVITVNAGDIIGLINPVTAPSPLSFSNENPGETVAAFSLVALSAGTPGATGASGATGATGAQGAQGAQGIQGPFGPTGPPGPIGPIGDTGATGATGATGTIGVVGNWSSSTTYQIGQVVFCAACSSNGSSYVATAANTNQDPPTQTGFWNLIAQAGATGPQGATGAQGTQGIQGVQGNTGAAGATGATGAPGGVLDFADFYALMPLDNAATVAAGTDVSFPEDGPASGSGLIARASPSSINLSAIGVYQVLFQVSVSEAGQLILTLNDADLAYTVVGRATGTSQIVGMALVQTTSVDSMLTVRNPAGNPTALTITPLAGGTRPVSAHLVITRIQ